MGETYHGHGVAAAAIVEVGVDFSQARHESFMQFAGREGMETDPVLPRLDPVGMRPARDSLPPD